MGITHGLENPEVIEFVVGLWDEVYQHAQQQVADEDGLLGANCKVCIPGYMYNYGDSMHEPWPTEADMSEVIYE